MRTKTRQEKLWDYLSKKLGETKLAKQVFHRIQKDFKANEKEIVINYKVDARPLKESLKTAKLLTQELNKISIRK